MHLRLLLLALALLAASTGTHAVHLRALGRTLGDDALPQARTPVGRKAVTEHSCEPCITWLTHFGLGFG